jgi:hypothetical protein
MSEPTRGPSCMARRAALAVVLFSAAALGLIVWNRVAPDSLHAAALEDGPIENVSAAGFLAAAIAFAFAAHRAGDARWRPRVRVASRVWLWVAALGAFVFAGEELSWGQRIFGFATPEPLREVNRQGEFNVHNVGSLQWLKYSLLVGTVALVGVVMPWLRLIALGRTLLARLAVPVAPIVYSGLFLAALLVLRHAANWLAMADRNDAQEYGEMLFALGLLLFGVHAAVRPPDVFVAEAAPACATAAPATGC